VVVGRGWAWPTTETKTAAARTDKRFMGTPVSRGGELMGKHPLERISWLLEIGSYPWRDL
jgi:hypothetical protein